MTSQFYRELGATPPSLEASLQFRKFQTNTTGPKFLRNSFSVKKAKVDYSESATFSTPVNMNVFPEPIEKKLHRMPIIGDMLFYMQDDSEDDKAIQGMGKFVNYPVLQLLLKNGYYAARNDLNSRTASVLRSVTGKNRLSNFNEQLSSGYRIRTSITSGEYSHGTNNALGKIESSIIDKNIKAFGVLLDSKEDVLCDQDVLERFCYDEDAARAQEHHFIMNDYQSWIETNYSQFKNYISTIEKSNQEEEEHYEADSDASGFLASVQKIKEESSDTMATLLDEAIISPSASKCIALYDLKQIFDKSMVYLTPSLVYSKVRYIGVVSSDFNTGDKESTLWDVLNHSDTYGVTVSGGPVNMLLYNEQKMKQHDKVFLTLQRHHNLKTKRYDYVQGVFRTGCDAETAFSSAEDYMDSWISHIDGKRHARVCRPLASKNTWCLATYKHTEINHNCSQDSFMKAQMKGENVTIQNAISARDDLPIAKVYVRNLF